MRIINENYETIDKSDVDLSKGQLFPATVIREDATPIDDITKFAWADEDYEEVQMYVLNSEPEEHARTAQDDTDAMVVDHEYRLTLLELGIYESEG